MYPIAIPMVVTMLKRYKVIPILSTLSAEMYSLTNHSQIESQVYEGLTQCLVKIIKRRARPNLEEKKISTFVKPLKMVKCVKNQVNTIFFLSTP